MLWSLKEPLHSVNSEKEKLDQDSQWQKGPWQSPEPSPLGRVVFPRSGCIEVGQKLLPLEPRAKPMATKTPAAPLGMVKWWETIIGLEPCQIGQVLR